MKQRKKSESVEEHGSEKGHDPRRPPACSNRLLNGNSVWMNFMTVLYFRFIFMDLDDFISILLVETRYLWAPSLSPIQNSVGSFDLFIVDFCFSEKSGEERWRGRERERERERRRRRRRRMKKAGERGNADTGFFHEFSNNFVPQLRSLH